MAAAATPSRTKALSLLGSLLRTSCDFCDYNIMEYAKRRAVDAFRSNKNLFEASAISAVYFDGKAQLEVAKRQVVVYFLFALKVKSIMEVDRPRSN